MGSSFQQLTSSQTTLPELPVPLVDNSTMKVLLSGPQQAQMGTEISLNSLFDPILYILYDRWLYIQL